MGLDCRMRILSRENPGGPRTAGQTLVEVLVATVVLGVGLVAVMRAFSTCTAGVGVVRGRIVAREYAAGLMSELRANPSLLMSDETGEIGDAHPGFTWRRRVRETREQGVLAVEITVEWRVQGMRRSYVLETLVQAPRA